MSIRISIGYKRLKADVADTTSSRARGLSGREKMDKNECMLFIFPYKAKHALWMRGMKFPIDVLWLDAERKIISMKEDLPPATIFEFKTYSPNKQAKYVIELPAGFIKKNKVKMKSKIVF